mgnify:CR=1 FL=1
MNLNKADLERMTKNLPEDDNNPLPDTSYVLDDVKGMINKINLYNNKKLYNNLNPNEFVEKLKRDYNKLEENFPSIFEKVLSGTLEYDRLEFMLKMLGEVKTQKLSKHEASVVVGQELVNNIVKPSLEEKDNNQK